MPEQEVSVRCELRVVALGEWREPGRIYRFTRAEEQGLFMAHPGAFTRVYPLEKDLPMLSVDMRTMPAEQPAEQLGPAESVTAVEIYDALLGVLRSIGEGDEPGGESKSEAPGPVADQEGEQGGESSGVDAAPAEAGQVVVAQSQAQAAEAEIQDPPPPSLSDARQETPEEKLTEPTDDAGRQADETVAVAADAGEPAGKRAGGRATGRTGGRGKRPAARAGQ